MEAALPAPRPILIVPGLNDSAPGHWQSWLEAKLPNTERVAQADWGLPDLEAWSSRVRAAVERSASPPVIVAHSFGVLAAVHASRRTRQYIAGALLVAPADPKVFEYDQLLTKFPLPFPTTLVVSRNDPWMDYEEAVRWGEAWRARIVDAGHVAHINTDSGHGPWPQVLELLDDLAGLIQPTRVHTLA